MNKYIVVDLDEAREKNYPDVESNFGRSSDHCYICYETDGEKPIRFVGTDSAEPEDKILIRDFSWVIDELNKLAIENEKLQTKVDDLLDEINFGGGCF